MNRTKPVARFGNSMRPAVLAALLIALTPGVVPPASAQANEEKPRWFGASHGNTTMLAYGVPDSDYIMLSFSCIPGKPEVNVNVQDEESTAKAGAVLNVSLSTGGKRIAFSEKAIPNEDSGGKDVEGRLPLDDALRHILTATDTLEIVVDGHRQKYAMAGAAVPAARLLGTCDAPKPANDLDVTVTNKASRPLHSLGYAETGVASFDSDAFGYAPLAPGTSRSFTIPAGRDICTFDIAVTFVTQNNEECCGEGKPAGTQNLCEKAEFIVHDPLR